MGIIGTPFVPAMPVVGTTPGPQWASDTNTFAAEVELRLEAIIDSASIALTTGDIKHATRTIQLGAAAGQGSGTTWTKGTGAAAGYHLGVGATDTVEFALELERNRRLTAVRMTGRSVATAWTFRVWLVDTATAARAQLGATQTSGTATSIEELSVSGLTSTLADGQHVIAEWTSGAAATRCLGIEADYDRQVAT